MKSEYDLRQILYVAAEAHLWYLYAMIPMYLVMPFFQVMCRHMNLKQEKAFLIVATGAVLFNYLLWMMQGEAYYDLPIIGDRIYAYYIFIGYYLFKYRRHIRLSQRSAALLCGAGLILTFAVTLGVTAATGKHYEDALTYACPLVAVASAAFFLFVIRMGNTKLVPGKRAKRIIDMFCGCSFGIYLIHILFLDNYKKYMAPTDLSAWIAVPALTVGIGAVSFLCVMILRKFRIGRKIT